MKRQKLLLSLVLALSMMVSLLMFSFVNAATTKPEISGIDITTLPTDSVTDKLDEEGWKWDPEQKHLL